jgi:hypothetical protein
MDGRTTAATARELRGCLDALAVDVSDDDGPSLALLRALRELAR